MNKLDKFTETYLKIINESISKSSFPGLTATQILDSLNGDYEKLLDLSEHEQADILSLLRCPQEAIDVLLNSDYRLVKLNLSRRGAYPTEQTIKMFEDENEDKYVRQNLAESTKLPLDVILKYLSEPSKDETDRFVKSNLPRNANVPAEELEKLVKNPDPWIRNSILWNPHCTREIMVKLSNDYDEIVRNHAYHLIRQGR